ncbi:MAG: HU family DNA-binding protein [Candidatus Cloacimonetes bacterium]|nr:HU family DNA-binding protein [Candidatus Cloacimonadota bacterium]
MNKNELCKRIADSTPLNQKEAAAAVDAFIEVVKSELAQGNKIQLVGFGTWEIKERAARSGVNPQTRKPLTIPAAKMPKFTPGKILKDSVNG